MHVNFIIFMAIGLFLSAQTHGVFMFFMVSLFILWIAFELATTCQDIKVKIKTTDCNLLKAQNILEQIKELNLESDMLIQQQLTLIKQQVSSLEAAGDNDILLNWSQLMLKFYENTVTTYTTIWQKL